MLESEEKNAPTGAPGKAERSLKVRRGQLKGVLTRVLNSIEMSISEDNIDEVKRLFINSSN